MKPGDAQAEPRGVSTDLVERREPEVAVERGVLDPLRRHRPRRLLEANDELLVPRLLQEEDAPQLLADVRPADLDAVELVEAAGIGLDVGPVHVEGRECERQVLEPHLLVQAAQLRLEDVDRHLELCERRDVLEAARVARELLVERCERLLRLGVHAQREHVVQELVAGRALDRPRTKLFPRLEDLLHPHVLDAGITQARQILRRIREPIGMIDANAVDDAVTDELDHLGVRRPEHVPLLLLDAAELADVEEAAMESGAEVDVEEHLAQLRVAPERVLVNGRHVVRDDVEDDPEAGSRELPKPPLAAERLGDVPGVDDVVAVLRALPRLEDGREIQVRDAEVPQIGDELSRRGEPELGRQLKAVGGPHTRRNSAIERDSTTTSPPGTGRSHAQFPVARTSSQCVPKRRAGSRNVISSKKPLKSIRNESSRTSSPCVVSAPSSSPFRKIPIARDSVLSQLRRVIRRPSGRIHQTSGRCSPPPSKNFVRRKTGCVRRSSISRRVKASSSSSPATQSIQESSLSWHHALLFPRCVRPDLVAAEQHRDAL